MEWPAKISADAVTTLAEVVPTLLLVLVVKLRVMLQKGQLTTGFQKFTRLLLPVLFGFEMLLLTRVMQGAGIPAGLGSLAMWAAVWVIGLWTVSTLVAPILRPDVFRDGDPVQSAAP